MIASRSTRRATQSPLHRPVTGGPGSQADRRSPMRLTLALWLAIPAVTADDPPRMIDGIARLAGTGRPAAGLTLQIIEQADPKYAVVVDAQGRFRAPSPPSWPVPQPDGVAPPCTAVAEPEGRWHIEPI